MFAEEEEEEALHEKKSGCREWERDTNDTEEARENANVVSSDCSDSHAEHLSKVNDDKPMIRVLPVKPSQGQATDDLVSRHGWNRCLT